MARRVVLLARLLLVLRVYTPGVVAVAAVMTAVIVVPAATPAPTSNSPTARLPWLSSLTVRVVPAIVPLKMATGSLWALLRSAWGMLRS